MQQTNIYGYQNIISKHIATSSRVRYATCSPYANLEQRDEGVPPNNKKERGGLHTSRHIVPTALLVRLLRSRKDLYKAMQVPSTRSIVLSMITRSYILRRRRVTIFETEETKSLRL